MNQTFGHYIRERREDRRKDDSRYSLRQLALRVGVEPSYLSKVERGEVARQDLEVLKRHEGELQQEREAARGVLEKVQSEWEQVRAEEARISIEVARSEGEVLQALGTALGLEGFGGRYDAREISSALASQVPAFEGCSWDAVGDGGAPLAGSGD